MLLPIRIKEEDKILILAPHPDDEAIGCGGLISRYASQCTIVVATDGSNSDKSVPPETMRITRKNEFTKEMQLVKPFSYKLLDYEDGYLFEYQQCFDGIDFSEYTKVFLPCRDDNHLDHTVTFDYALKKIQSRCEVTEVYQYEVHTPFHNVTEYLDITDCMDKKVELIGCHESQIKIHDYITQTRSLAEYRACQAGAPNKYYETYVRVEIDYKCGDDQERKNEIEIARYKSLFRMTRKWISNILGNVSPSTILLEKGITKVVIYGAGDIGVMLATELKNKGIKVSAIIDNNKSGVIIQDVKLCLAKEVVGRECLVIITVAGNIDSIKQELDDLGYKNIVSFVDLLNENI